MTALIFLRGGGDLASGIGLRLHRAGLRLIVTELERPLVVRRLASFAEAVYQGHTTVEGVAAVRVGTLSDALEIIPKGCLPVLVDPNLDSLRDYRRIQAASSSTPVITILIDARMTKQPPETGLDAADLVIGLGPGFTAGENCQAVIETQRGPSMGRVLWHGSALPNTGQPEPVAGRKLERVLRAPGAGILQARAEIGDHLEPGQVVAEVSGLAVTAPFAGVLRGLLHSGLEVTAGLKIGDLDPRDDPLLCRQVSDKALAVGGGVLEAILTRPELRLHLWG